MVGPIRSFGPPEQRNIIGGNRAFTNTELGLEYRPNPPATGTPNSKPPTAKPSEGVIIIDNLDDARRIVPSVKPNEIDIDGDGKPDIVFPKEPPTYQPPSKSPPKQHLRPEDYGIIVDIDKISQTFTVPSSKSLDLRPPSKK